MRAVAKGVSTFRRHTERERRKPAELADADAEPLGAAIVLGLSRAGAFRCPRLGMLAEDE
jgi:hypothetical protein